MRRVGTPKANDPQSPMALRVVISCEHAGRWVPAAFRPLFRAAAGVLDTHEAYDIGAAWLARKLALALSAPCFEQRLCRLLIDSNRSVGNPALFSRFSRGLSLAQRGVLQQLYEAHRARVTEQLAANVVDGACSFHLAVHSFTPQLDGQIRNCDIGLLYDPRRPAEKALARRWQAALRQIAPDLVVRRNYPYRGNADGLTTALRRRFHETEYVGIELEVNQRLLAAGSRERERVARAVMLSLAALRP